MGGRFRVCLGALILALLLAVSGRGDSTSKIDVDLSGHPELLPLTFAPTMTSNGGVSSKPVRFRYRVVRPGYGDSVHAEIMLAYNAALNVDFPAAVSYQDYNTRSVIDDTPLWLTITEFTLIDVPGQGQVAAIFGYRNDSAFAVTLVPGADSVDWLYLCSGVDQTGNGEWEPTVFTCATNDYDFDGRPEVFVYVNPSRDLRPRELFSLEVAPLRLEWSLPVASIVSDRTLLPTGDTTDPGVIFVSYNPKQHVSDSVFSDSWAYLTVVDTAGAIRFNRIVSAEHGGMYLYPTERTDEFYLAHTIPLTDPTDTIDFPDPVNYLSRITADGDILARTTAGAPPNCIWSAADLGPPSDDIFVLDRSGYITRYDPDLHAVARSDETPLGGYLGSLQLSPAGDRALVFNGGGGAVFLDPNFQQIGLCDHSGSIVEPLRYDADGRLREILFSGGNSGSIETISSRDLWAKLQAVIVRFRLELLALAFTLLIALVLLNHRRLRAVEKLRRSEADYHAFIMTSPDIVFRVNRDGVLLHYEARDRSMLLIPPEEFLNRPMSRFMPADLAQAALERIGKTLATGTMQTMEYELTLAGHDRVFEARMAPVTGDEIIMVVRDITDRTRAQDALRQSEERFRTLVANLPGVIYRCAPDPARTMDFISDGIENVVGFPATDFIDNAARSFADIIHPDDRAAVIAAIDAGIAGNRPFIVEYRVIDIDGNIHWVYEKGQGAPAESRTSGEADSEVWLDGAIFDITEQRAADEALRESEEKLRAQYKGIPVPTYTWQRSGDDFVLIDYNDAAIEITHGGVTGYVGKLASEMYREHPQVLADFEQCFREKTIVNREVTYEFVTTDRFTDLSIRYVFVPPDLVMVHTEDITERKRSRELLDQRLRYEEGLAACSATLLASPASDGTIDSALRILLEATGLCRVYLFENFQDPKLGLCGAMTHEVHRDGVQSLFGQPDCERFAYEPDRTIQRDRLAAGSPVVVQASELPDQPRRLMEEKRVRSCLLLPIFVGARWNGFVGFDDTRTERKWNEQDIRLLRTAAEMLSSYFAIVETQRRLVEERDFNRSILQTANSLIVCLDEEGRITVFNDELERVTGYKREEVLGTSWLERFVPKRYQHAELNRFGQWVREHPEDRYERELLTRSGEERIVLWSNSMMINPHTGALTAIAIGHDTTDRRRAEAAVHEAAEKYRAVMEQSSDNIYLMDVATGKVIEANVALQQLLGYSAEEMQDLSVYDFSAHEKDDVDDKINQVLGGGLSFLPERYYRCRDGRMVPVEVVANSIEYSNRQVLCIVSRDITQRKEAERALREQEEKYRLLVENVRASIALIDYEGEFLFVNETGARAHHRTAVDMTGMSMWELFPQDVADRQMDAIRQVIDNRTQVHRETYTCVGGEWRWYYINIQPFTDAYGRVTSAVLIAHDITESKAAQEALTESEQRFRELADLLPQTLFETDATGFITYTNRQGFEISGYSEDDLAKSLHIEKLFEDRDRADALDNFRRRLQGHPPIRVEYNMRRKDGSTVPVLIYSAPIIRDGETIGLRGVLVDITEQRQAEEQVRLANQERYLQMKEIAGGIAHEIYNALYPASVSIERIRHIIGDHEQCEPERVDRLVNLTDKAVRRAISLTESVTRFSRLESEKQEELISLKALFEEIIEGHQHEMESLGVHLRNEVADELNVSLRRTHAFSLFNNLVANALDAVAETEHREVQIQGRLDNGWVRVEIADSGPGVPPDARDKIFAPFYSTKPNRGTGLGLAMAVKLAELYGGAIRLDPDLDTMTRFIILLPQAVTL